MIISVGLVIIPSDWRCRFQGRRQPQREQLALVGRDGREPLRRGDRPVRVQRLVRPLAVVVGHPGVDRRLRRLDAGEGAGDVEEVGPQRAVESFYLPVLVR